MRINTQRSELRGENKLIYLKKQMVTVYFTFSMFL